MADEPKSTKYLVSVASGLTVAAIIGGAAWAWQYSPMAWSSIVSVAAGAWALVSFPIQLPLWALVLLIAFAVCVPRIVRAWPFDANAELAPALSSATPEPSAPLNEHEIAIIRALAAADGDPLSDEEIGQRTRISRLLVQHHAANLEKHGLTEYYVGGFGGIYSLTPEGRSFVIENGYALKGPPTSRRI